MHAKLICKTGSMDGMEFAIGKEATIGKAYQNTIVLEQNDISRNHARIYFDDAEKSYFLEDLDSRNGTHLDGEKIYEKEHLSNIHVITFGDGLEFFFQVLKSKEGLIDSKTSKSENQIKIIDDMDIIENVNTIIADDFSKALKPTLKVSQNDGPGRFKNESTEVNIIDEQELLTNEELPEIIHRRESPLDLPDVSKKRRGKKDIANFDFSEKPIIKHKVSQGQEKVDSGFVLNIKGLKKTFVLKEGRNIVGRIPTCDITLHDETVSRQHACILIDNNTVRLKDLGSKNFTFFGKKKIKSITEILPNAIIRFGEVEAILGHDDAR